MAADSGQAHFRELLTAHYPLVQQVVRSVGRRHWLTADETEELGSIVRLRMVENDYAILRQWRGESALKSYLTTVITRIHLDSRTARWGRWRPSALARHLGATAVHLERLTWRDGLPLAEAIEALRTNYGVTASSRELEALHAALPRRMKRRMVGEVELENVPAPEARPEDPRLDRLRASFAALPRTDRHILGLIYVADHRIVDVARRRGLEPKTLYRQLERLRRQLRAQVTQPPASPMHA